jgi:hypothetical protein
MIVEGIVALSATASIYMFNKRRQSKKKVKYRVYPARIIL